MNPSITIESEMELLEAIKIIHPSSSNRTLRHMLTQKRVTVDGKIEVKAKSKISVGSIIEIHPKPVVKSKIVEIIYEDQDLIVVNKPSGLLTVATNKMETNTLHSKVQQYLSEQKYDEWGFIVHRLDKETSGIVLFAKNQESKMNLQNQFAERQVQRKYTAIVEGQIHEPGEAEDWLIEDKNLRVWIVGKGTKGAKKAITQWRPIKNTHYTTELELEINTGRRHQIRVQLAERGFPVVGDQAHGSKLQSDRLLLHATSLTFKHPDGNKMELLSNPPPSFANEHILLKDDMH